MIILITSPIASKPKAVSDTSLHTNPTPPPHPLLPFFLGLLLLIIIILASKPFITFDSNGQPILAEWRKKKLEKELDDLASAEQYVLKVQEAGYFPCFSCPYESTIFLQVNEVWKYGITTKGKIGRYGSGLPAKGLMYIIEFEGTLEQCLRQERLKIYNYALLPENLKRKIPLIRPPGNKKDS